MSYTSIGLEGVVVARTRLSSVDGQRGELVIAGHRVEDLAVRATWEEALHLLWTGHLPDDAEKAALLAELAAARALHPATLALLRAAAADGVAPMDALRMAAASLDLGHAGADDRAAAVRVAAALPTALAAYGRLVRGLEPIAPDPTLGAAASILYGWTGERPSTARVAALDAYLVTVCEHGLNASTFAARVVISTGSGVIDAVTAALGALKGPLHGGAPGPALELVREIGAPERAEAVIADKLAAGERLMGFGHRVYRVRDPRAEVLGAACQRLLAAGEGDPATWALARVVEQTALTALAAHRPERRLQTNVEFYTALLLDALGIDTPWFTPLFAVGRAAGWTAHCLEQRATSRLIRPSSEYVGPLPA